MAKETLRDSKAKTHGQGLADFSVIIPTKDRAEDLERTIASLLDQTIPPKELIIVDQSASEQGMRSVSCLLDGAKRRGAPIRLQYCWEPEISGGAEARNHAMRFASCGLWLFLDDDVILERDFLSEMLRVYDERPDAAGVSGIITNYARPPIGMRAWSTTFVRGPFSDDRQPVYWNWARHSNRSPVRVSRLGGGLMSFRASEVRNLGFDANLRGVSDGEDVDFCQQLTDKVLFIAPRARLKHCSSPVGRLSDHWLRRSARAMTFLYFKNWRHGIRNRLAYLWLRAGYALAATWSSFWSLSLAPWRALKVGVAEGRAAASGR